MRRYGVGMLVVALAAGCSPAGHKAPAPAPREAWRQASFTPIGQPVVEGDIAVAYGTVDRDLLLFGVSVADGAVRWRQAASPSVTTTGIPLSPAVIDHRVVYFRPDGRAELAARLVVAAPETGADLLVSEPQFFRSHPRSCDDGKDLCADVLQDDAWVSRRFVIGTTGSVPERAGAPAGSRYVGEELLDLGRRDPEMLAGFQRGEVQWRSPLSRYFSAGHTTDRGWYFELYRAAGLHVGTVGTNAEGDARSGGVDLSTAETAAIRATDGAPAWRTPHTDFLCDAKIDLKHTVDGRSEAWPVRCRLQGILHYDPASQRTSYDGLDVTVEGFDIATGATTWSVPLGAAEVFMEEDRHAVAVSATEVLIQGAGGPLILDVSSGASRPAAPNEAFWCAKDVDIEYRETLHFGDGRTTNRWRGGTLVYACAGDGSPAATIPRSIAPSLGAKVGDRTVLGTAEGLVAYDPPAPAPA